MNDIDDVIADVKTPRTPKRAVPMRPAKTPPRDRHDMSIVRSRWDTIRYRLTSPFTKVASLILIPLLALATFSTGAHIGVWQPVATVYGYRVPELLGGRSTAEWVRLDTAEKQRKRDAEQAAEAKRLADEAAEAEAKAAEAKRLADEAAEEKKDKEAIAKAKAEAEKARKEAEAALKQAQQQKQQGTTGGGSAVVPKSGSGSGTTNKNNSGGTGTGTTSKVATKTNTVTCTGPASVTFTASGAGTTSLVVTGAGSGHGSTKVSVTLPKGGTVTGKASSVGAVSIYSSWNGDCR